MHTTTVLSLSWREGGPQLLASCTTPPKERPALLSRLAAELHAQEVVYLATCNRVEVAYRSHTPLPTDEARRAVLAALAPNVDTQPRAWRAWANEGAIEHLFLVAAGLASAKVGETEIAGQLRISLALSRDLGLCGGPLGDFIDEALRCAGRIRNETTLYEGRTSLAEIALDRLRLHRSESDEPYRVAILGRSAMTERCARSLAAEGCQLHWINRTPANLHPIADELGATVHPLSEFRDQPVPVDAVLSATGATDPILNPDALARLALAGTTLIIDLSISPDISSTDAAQANIEHLGLEAILHEADRTRTEKSAAAAEARLLVDEALLQLSTRHSARSAGQAASRLHERFRSDASRAADEALEREFKHLPPDDADRLRRFADLLARRLAHDPAKGLRRLAAVHGPTAADHFLDDATTKDVSK
jgi:glutamyl-tRNA reductase